MCLFTESNWINYETCHDRIILRLDPMRSKEAMEIKTIRLLGVKMIPKIIHIHRILLGETYKVGNVNLIFYFFDRSKQLEKYIYRDVLLCSMNPDTE